MKIQKRYAAIIFTTLFMAVCVVSMQAQVTTSVQHFDTPFLLAAAGQSPDAVMVKIVAQKEKLDFDFNSLADAGDVPGNKSMMLVMGVSMKGLGAAGIKLNEEMDRVDRLIAAAHEDNIPVIGMFAGGAGGRGGRDNYTDEIIRQVAPKVDYLVAVRTGDKDGFIKGIAEENGIPLTYFNTIVDMTKIIPQMYK